MRFSISFLIIVCLCATLWANSLKAKLVKKTDSGTASPELNDVLSELISIKKQYQGDKDVSAGVEQMKLSQENSRTTEADKTDEAMRVVDEMIGENSNKYKALNYLAALQMKEQQNSGFDSLQKE